MQTPGTYISAAGHIVLIGWLFLGWGLDSEPIKFDAMDVSVISGEEFDQMFAATTPEPGSAEPTAPAQPLIDEAAPPPIAQIQPAEPAPLPDAVEQPVEELPPPEAPAPLVTDATDTPPATPAAPAAPPPSPNVDVSTPPAPTQADRIASTPSAPPPPDAQVDSVVREEVVPNETAPAEVATEEVTPTAPEETATEIAIEDVKPSGLVETSLRPVSRPSRPTPPTPTPEPVETAEAPVQTPAPATPEPAATEDAVNAALAAAMAAEAPAVAAGPPMTGSERDSFRISVNSCWNVDPGSVASRVIVEVKFELGRDGKVIGQPVMLSAQGDQSAVNTAFEAARRAILRCQSGGYQLPPEKYDQWKEVVITFDPSGMRLR